jgi:RimJ/RimL family protein N-acetyltransferase
MRLMMAPQEIETERLKLRQICELDLDAYAAIIADPEVMRYIGEGKPQSRADAWRTIATISGHWGLRGYGLWAVDEKSTGKLIGRAGLWFPEGWPMIEVGWALAREHWGKGYATEAARAALKVAQDNDCEEVCSLILPDNARSIRVAEKLGMTNRGPIHVTTFDCLLYSIRRGA